MAVQGEITIALDARPLSKDLRRSACHNGRALADLLLGAVLRNTNDESVPQAGIASGAEPVDDGQVWRVRLDAHRTWADGRSVHAEDLVRAVSCFLDSPGVLSSHLGAARCDISAEAVDAATVLFRLSHPIGYFPYLLTLPQFAPRHGWRTDDCGPFLGRYALHAWTDAGIELHKNYGLDGAEPERLQFRFIERPSEVLDAFDRGDIDVTPITSFDCEHLGVLSARPELTLHAKPLLIFGWVDFGRQSGLLRERADLRRLLGSLIDRTRLQEDLGGLVCRTESYLGVVSQSAAPETPSPAELQALREACPESLTVAFSDYAPNATVAARICADITNATGIPTRAHKLTFQQYVRAAVTQGFCLLYTLTTADFAHPAATVAPWHSGSANARRTGFNDSVLDCLIEKAQVSSDSTTANSLWLRADMRLRELAPRLPILQVVGHYLCSNRV